MNFKFFLIFFLHLNILSNIDLKPWEDWWQNNFNVDLFNSYWGDSNSISRKIIRDTVNKQAYKSIIDVGSGIATDFLAFKSEKIETEYHAIEITPKLVEYCKSKGLDVQQASAENIPYQDNTFDFVYCRHLLEHLSDYEQAISEFIRVAKRHVAIVFFIKPSDKIDNIDLSTTNEGCLLFHNKYNKEKLERFIKENSKVKNISWQNVNEKEIILHIHVQANI